MSANNSFTLLPTSPIYLKIAGILLIIICILACLGNGTVLLVAIYRSRKSRNVNHLLVANLSLCHLLTAIVVVPLQVVTYFYEGGWVLGEIMCRIHRTLDFVLSAVVLFTLASIAIDRLFVVAYPAERRLTKFKIQLLIFLSWSLSLLLNIPRAFVLSPRQVRLSSRWYCWEFWPSALQSVVYLVVFTSVTLMTPLCVTLVCYIVLWRAFRLSQIRVHDLAEAKRHCGGSGGTAVGAVRLSRGECSTKDTVKTTEMDQSKSANAARPTTSKGKVLPTVSRRNVANEQRLLTLLLLMFFSFLSYWTPVTIIMFFVSIAPALPIHEALLVSVFWFCRFQLCTDAILYGFAGQTFRKSLTELFQRPISDCGRVCQECICLDIALQTPSGEFVDSLCSDGAALEAMAGAPTDRGRGHFQNSTPITDGPVVGSVKKSTGTIAVQSVIHLHLREDSNGAGLKPRGNFNSRESSTLKFSKPQAPSPAMSHNPDQSFVGQFRHPNSPLKLRSGVTSNLAVAHAWNFTLANTSFTSLTTADQQIAKENVYFTKSSKGYLTPLDVPVFPNSRISIPNKNKRKSYLRRMADLKRIEREKTKASMN